MKVTEIGLLVTSIRTIFILNHVSSVLGGVYNVADSHRGRNFLNGSEFQAFGPNDPTHGRVNYVDVDSTQVLDPAGPGRASIRLMSKNAYTTFAVVTKLSHMPQGCSTWPSIWTLNPDWPDQGEIDIMEGTNNLGSNTMTLHTSSGCMMPHTVYVHRPGHLKRTRTTISTDCNALKFFNQGCGVQSANPNSYGYYFNQVGGGWFAAEKTDDFILVWSWSTDDPNVPTSVANGSSTIDTSMFSPPSAAFPNLFCDIPGHFGPQNIMIDCTLYFVNTQPAAFVDAFWNFTFLNVYT